MTGTVLARPAALAFIASIVLVSMQKDRASELPGALFHILLLPVVTALPAPEWARATGYAWIAIDIVASIAALNDVPRPLCWPIRLGGHVLAALWVAGTSVGMPVWRMGLGVVLAVWMGGYAFVARRVPLPFFMPAGALLVVWLVAIALA